MNFCLFCKVETSNPKFCSRSCAATFNNTLVPKRKLEPQNACQVCGKRRTGISLKCRKCINSSILISNKTLHEAGMWNAPSRATWNNVRKNARKVMSIQNVEKRCKICSFDFYVEVCHIKPISSFPLDAKISEVNDLTNLVYLCPNHHIMMDRGKLVLPTGDHPVSPV